MHKRNVEGLRNSAQLRRERTMQRAEEGIRRLLQEHRPITFQAVAERADVSTAWLYQNREIRSRIEHLRELHPSHRTLPPKAPLDSAKEAILATLRQRIKQLENENRELKQQLEIVYGQLYKQKP